MAIAGVICVVATGPAQADPGRQARGATTTGIIATIASAYLRPSAGGVLTRLERSCTNAPPVYVPPPPPSWGLTLVFPFSPSLNQEVAALAAAVSLGLRIVCGVGGKNAFMSGPAEARHEA